MNILTIKTLYFYTIVLIIKIVLLCIHMPNEFIIKINTDSNGNPVSLNSMTIDASEALNLFHKSLTDFAKIHQEDSNIRIKLKDGCIEGILEYSSDTITDEITNGINNNSVNNDTISFLKEIQNKIQDNGLDYSVFHKVNNQRIDYTTNFKSGHFIRRRGARQEWIESVQFLQGKLFETGGRVKTNIHIEFNNEEFKIECTQEQAKKLNERLYDVVYLSILKRQKFQQKDIYVFMDSYLKEEKFNEYKNFIHEFNSCVTLERFDLLHDKIVNIIEINEKPFGELVKFIRLFTYQQCDRGTLRTILMALKPIRNDDDKLLESYTKLAIILRTGSKNHII